jgi:hypothetical protein
MTRPTLHPLPELCATLHLTEQTLRRFLRSIGFQAIQGGDTLLFTDEDITVIIEARRKCRLRSSRRDQETTPLTGYAAPSEASISTRLQALRTKHLQTPSGSSERRRSSKRASLGHAPVVGFPTPR